MILKKKSIIILLALTIIFAAASYYYFAIYNSVRDVHTASSYKGFSTAQALFSGADLVIIGTPVKDFEDREVLLKERSTGVIEYIVTSTEIDVEKVLKGSEEDAIDLKVIEPIGIRQTLRGRERIASDGYTAMKKGSKYVIFLGKNSYGQYGVINMQAGKFNVDGTDTDDVSIDNPNKQRILTELTTDFAQELK